MTMTDEQRFQRIEHILDRLTENQTELRLLVAKLETDIAWLKAGMFTVIGLLLPILGLLISLSVRR